MKKMQLNTITEQTETKIKEARNLNIAYILEYFLEISLVEL